MFTSSAVTLFSPGPKPATLMDVEAVRVVSRPLTLMTIWPAPALLTRPMDFESSLKFKTLNLNWTSAPVAVPPFLGEVTASDGALA